MFCAHLDTAPSSTMNTKPKYTEIKKNNYCNPAHIAISNSVK